jgi:DNA-binding CsgD family transcriptional regulator
MWRSNSLEGFLADMDTLECRRAYRAAPPMDPGSGPRHATFMLVRPRSEDAAVTDRRGAPRRPGPKAAKSQVPGDLAAAASALLNHLDHAIVLLDPGGYVRLANAAARRIAARGDCLRIRTRRVQLTDRQAQAALKEFLNTGIDDPLPSGPQCLCRRSGGPIRYVIVAEWLNSPALIAQPLAALVIYEPNQVGRVNAELLASLYGLTQMQSQLAAALYSVARLDAAAARCGVTLNTAKTHMKRVFSKCGVSSKAEFLRLLALGPRSR